ncbi:sushi domain-containing protein 1 isoform X2 [Rhineura floridana]|uniref:sushi domain-containing protein 1 isoform X2 n=1 Tax=Rhineura floridana TaxID=261503 RepID=UPI002AC89144|nr:sushi domain-containing protein 1 isoform X2 [Rhineura floridana]
MVTCGYNKAKGLSCQSPHSAGRSGRLQEETSELRGRQGGGVESEYVESAGSLMPGLHWARTSREARKEATGDDMTPTATEETRRHPALQQRRWPPSPSLLLLLVLLLLLSFSEEKEPDATSDLPSDVCATCHANATCHQVDSKSVCICNYGFVGNGRTYCQDKDECDIGTSKICGDHASCHNTYGSFYCVCLEGFQASNRNKIFIPNDGTKCIVVDCGLPPSFPNAYFAVNRTTYGNKVVYTCQPGYVIKNGNYTAVCNSRGQWKEADFVCKEIDCGKPQWFPNTDIIWDNTTTLGSTIYYKCKERFHYFGERNFSQCTMSQKWENITFECKEITCGQPPVINHTNMIWNKIPNLGNVVEYKCIKGFYHTSMKRHSFCTQNGSWEILDLRCEKVQEFVDIALNNSCLTWRRRNGNAVVNETYQLIMRMLGNESKKTAAESKMNLTTTEEAIKMCLQLRQNANYSVEVTTESTNLALKIQIIQPVVEKKVVMSNITIFNDTCIKWKRESLSEENYVLQVQGLRWYQKQFCDNMTHNFTTHTQNPEVCLDLLPGTNYTVNISTRNPDHSALIYMETPITDPPSPEVEFISVQGSAPLFSLRKAEEKNGPISSYQVIVIPWSLQCNFNCHSLTSLTYFSKGTDTEGYVTAEIPAKVVADNILDLALGDRLYYGEFYNAPLKQGKDYCVVLRTISEWNKVKKQSCVVWAQIKDLSSPPQHMTIVLFGSVAALCSILLLLLSVACTQHISPSSLTRKTFSNETGHLSTTINIAERSITSYSPMLQTVSLL